MIDVDSASLGPQEEFVIRCAEYGEEDAFSRDSADEFTFCVKDQHFTVLTEDHEEASEVCDETLLDVLLNVDSLLQLEVALVELPQFYAGLLDGEELDLAGEVYLRSLP